MTDETSAGSALKGYFYQVRVSVWIALDIALARRLVETITLEPANEEDLEASIAGEADAGTARFTTSGYSLAIQCKNRTTGPFDVADISRLLNHGTRRQKPADRLKETSNRYLLVTDADLRGAAANLAIRQVGDWPRIIPPSIRRALPADSDGRLAILNRLDDEKLESRISELLQGRFKVPRQQVIECRDALEDEALARMRGQANGVWTRTEIERIIISYNGYLGTSETLDGYVEPTNWQELKQTLEKHHAVVIVGASGTGKTRTAQALVASLRDSVPGMRHVYVDGGPEKVRADNSFGDVVFEIEDPWGKYRLSPNALPWNDSIAPLLESAGPGRKFVITSRSDILTGAAAKLQKKWTVGLEDDNYGTKERGSLFDRRFNRLPRNLQHLLLAYRKDAVEHLRTPLEMDRFFGNLMGGADGKENDATYVNRCLSEAHQTSIETALINGIEQTEAWGVAAATWGMFQVQPRFSFEIVPALQSGLAQRMPELEDRLLPFLNFLIAGRNLRQVGPVLSIQHNRVQKGLEEAMARSPGRASRVLDALVETLLDVDRQVGADWGTEGAARILAAVQKQQALSLSTSHEIKRRVDAWLDARVTQVYTDSFLADVDLAAMAGSRESDVAELARWLNFDGERPDWTHINHWRLPERPADWNARISASSSTRLILDAWVRRAMPERHKWFPDDFHVHATALAGNLTPAFIAAALDIAGSGYHDNDDAIAEGAINDIDGYEAVVTAAVAHEEKSASDYDDEFALRITNGELDASAAERYSESAGEETITSGAFLQRYVEARRRRGEWAVLGGHPHRNGLAWSWVRAAIKAGDATDAEWLAIAEAKQATRYEASLWRDLTSASPPALASVLRERISSFPPDAELRRSALHTALNNYPVMLGELIAEFARSQPGKFLALAIDLGDAIAEADGWKPVPEAAARALIVDLPAHEQGYFCWLARLQGGATPTGLAEILADILAPTVQLEVVRLELLAEGGQEVNTGVRAVLERRDDNTDAEIAVVLRAVEIAVARGTEPVLQLALQHRFADVREKSLVALARSASRPLPAFLLALAADKGNRVRKALLALLKDYSAPEHVDTLVALTQDTYSANDQYYGEETDYPIAQAAADLLVEQLGDIDADLARTLWDIASNCDDLDVKLRLMRAIARHGDEGLQARLLYHGTEPGKPLQRRLAAQALFLEHDKIPTALVDTITDDALRLLPADNAAYLCLLLGAKGGDDRVRGAVQELSINPDRRGLSLLIAWMETGRDVELAAYILRLLPSAQCENAIGAFSGNSKLASSDVDALADVRVAQVLKRFMKELIVEQPRVPAAGALVEM